MSRIFDQIIYSLSADFNYRKIHGHQCMSTTYRPSYNWEDAKIACSSDQNCVGVYDNYCDDKSPFYLCSKVREHIYTHENSNRDSISCIHEKEGKCWYIILNS